MTPIPAVNGVPYVNNAEFVLWNQYGNANSNVITTYTFSSSYKDETFTVDGEMVTFEAVGGLLQVGTQQRDIRVSGFDTSISLSGVDPAEMFRVLNRDTKGSEIKIFRGFYDSNYVLDTANVVPRFTGIVTSYTVDEDYVGLDDTVTLVLNCSSTRYVLQNLFGGRKTNPESWRQFYPNDVSMNAVPTLSQSSFDFGKTA